MRTVLKGLYLTGKAGIARDFVPPRPGFLLLPSHSTHAFSRFYTSFPKTLVPTVIR